MKTQARDDARLQPAFQAFATVIVPLITGILNLRDRRRARARRERFLLALISNSRVFLDVESEEALQLTLDRLLAMADAHDEQIETAEDALEGARS